MVETVEISRHALLFCQPQIILTFVDVLLSRPQPLCTVPSDILALDETICILDKNMFVVFWRRKGANHVYVRLY